MNTVKIKSIIITIDEKTEIELNIEQARILMNELNDLFNKQNTWIIPQIEPSYPIPINPIQPLAPYYRPDNPYPYTTWVVTCNGNTAKANI